MMDRREVLERYAAGDWDDDSPELRAALDSDPSLAEEIEELRQARLELDSLGDFEREALAEAAAEPDEGEDLDRIEASVRTHLRSADALRGVRNSRSLVWIPLAAAALLAALLLWKWATKPAGPVDPGGVQPIKLGGEERDVRPITPAPDAELSAAALTEFVWAGGGARYRVEVHTEETLQRGAAIALSPGLEETRWIPNALQLETIRAAAAPGGLIWIVYLTGDDGSERSMFEARFSLR